VSDSAALPSAAHSTLRRKLSFILPIVALILGGVSHLHLGPPPDNSWISLGISAVGLAILIPSVLIALHHADIVAEHIGQPFGTLLLTIAVTVIEVSIIVSIMLHGENNPTLARESVFSVFMIICAGGVGLCLTLGALRHGEQDHQPQGTSAYLAVLIALATLVLILPNYTLTTDPGTFSGPQLAFISVLSILLYGSFLYIQTVRHKSFFLDGDATGDTHGEGPGSGPLWGHIVCMIAGLGAVVLLAETVAAGVEDGLADAGVKRPDAIMGAVIAMMLLFPEILAASRAALGNQLQRSVNLLLGSALATIGLTIPAVAAVSLITDKELVLGLPGRDEVLLVLALILSIVSFGTGRTNVLTGIVHLVVFLAYLLLLVIP